VGRDIRPGWPYAFRSLACELAALIVADVLNGLRCLVGRDMRLLAQGLCVPGPGERAYGLGHALGAAGLFWQECCEVSPHQIGTLEIR
jgi:hypothetical protein